MSRPIALVALAALAAGCAPAAGTGAAPAPSAAEFPTTPPALGPAPALDAPDPVTRTLANGLKVLYVRQAELPVVSAVLVTRGAGAAEDPAELPGLASFTADMMDEGAGGRDALALADALEMLGASLSTTAAWDNGQVSLYVLRDNFPAALRLMADVVVRPDFPENEVQRLRDERVTSLIRGRDVPGVIAANAFQTLVYGGTHPYGRYATTDGTQQLNRARVAAFHGQRYRPENATLILVGDVDAAAMHPVVESAFGAWRATGAAPAAPAGPAAPEIGRTTLYLIDKPGAAQSEIRIGHPGVPRDHPDFYALQVMNTLLGGSFTSRLNQNLRETHGYTYGAGSSYQMRLGAGPFTASSAVRTNATDSALVEFFGELNRLRAEPIPADELQRAKNYVALGFPHAFETTRQVAGQFATLETYGIDASFFDTYVQRIMAVTAEDVRRVATEHVRPDRAVVVVVGDRAQVEAPIRALNLAPVEVREVAEFVR